MEELEKLIDKARNGDKDAYVQAMLMLEKELYNIASIRLKNPEDANDVIQETILKSFEHIDKLKDSKSFKYWIIRILINECNKMYMRRSRHTRIFNKMIKYEYSDNFSRDDIHDVERKIDFDAIVSKLKYNEQLVIVLYFSNRFNTREIAEMLHISVNTVKTRLRRAQEKIEKMLRKGEDNHE